MKLDMNALLKAAASGFGAGVIFTLAQIVPIVGLVCCCLMPFIWAGSGMLYGLWSRSNGNPSDPGQFAIGGAIAGAAAGLGGTIVNGIVVAVAGMSSIYAVYSELGIDVPAGSSNMGAVALGAIMGLCLIIFLSAGLGAAGGAIYAALTKDKAPAL